LQCCADQATDGIADEFCDNRPGEWLMPAETCHLLLLQCLALQSPILNTVPPAAE
jgi:hypothetical protein